MSAITASLKARSATGGKAANAWSLAGFWKIGNGCGSGCVPVKWLHPCLSKIYRGSPGHICLDCRAWNRPQLFCLCNDTSLLFSDDQLQDPRLMLSSLEQDMLCQVLSNFHNLSSLTLPTIANSELLEVVAMTMTCLKTLGLSMFFSNKFNHQVNQCCNYLSQWWVEFELTWNCLQLSFLIKCY